MVRVWSEAEKRLAEAERQFGQSQHYPVIAVAHVLCRGSTTPVGHRAVPGTSDRRIAAVDQQVGASHEARGVARKIEGSAADLLGLAETTDRMLRHRLSASVRHAAVPERDALGLDGAGRQRVDADV